MENIIEQPSFNNITHLLNQHDFDHVITTPTHAQMTKRLPKSSVHLHTPPIITAYSSNKNVTNTNDQPKPNFVSIKPKCLDDSVCEEPSFTNFYQQTLKSNLNNCAEEFTTLSSEIQKDLLLMVQYYPVLKKIPPPAHSDSFICQSKMLALDLDETLIYCFDKPFIPNDKDYRNIKSFTLKGREYYFVMRPFLEEFLSCMTRLYKIVV